MSFLHVVCAFIYFLFYFISSLREGRRGNMRLHLFILTFCVYKKQELYNIKN